MTFSLAFPRLQGALAETELPGKGGAAQAQLFPQGDDLPDLSAIKKAIVFVQQIFHRHLIERRQLVHDGGRVVGAGAGLHVDVTGKGDARLGGGFLLQQALAVAEPSQPFRYGDCLCIAAAKVMEFSCFR